MQDCVHRPECQESLNHLGLAQGLINTILKVGMELVPFVLLLCEVNIDIVACRKNALRFT